MDTAYRALEAGEFLILLYYLAVAVLVAVLLAKTANKLIKLIKRLQNIKRLRDSMSLDVFSVEGEVLSFTEERLGRMDTQYNVNIVYTVGTVRYYKEIILHNKGSLRVGQKLILLCDNDDPSNAVLQSGGGEEEALGGLFFALVIEIAIALYVIWGIFFNIKNGG